MAGSRDWRQREASFSNTGGRHGGSGIPGHRSVDLLQQRRNPRCEHGVEDASGDPRQPRVDRHHQEQAARVREADGPEGRAEPVRRGSAFGPVQRQAERRYERDRRHDVPTAPGGEAVRQERLPGRPQCGRENEQAVGLTDFQSGPVVATTYKDKAVGVPIISEQEVLYHRKHLLKKAGLEVPKTMDELQAAAKTIKAQNPGVAGFIARTGKSLAVTQFSSFLYSFGGDFIDANGKSGVASDAAKKAYAFYGGLIHNYGPANVSTDMSWPEAMAIFTQGKAGLYPAADSLYKNATDPVKSKVANTVGFAPMPAGATGSKAYNVPSWALGVNAASTNQANA